MKAHSFKRNLSLFDSIFLIVTLIVGAGIFETAPLVARGWPSIAGVIILWILGGLISLCGALVYAELATTYPEDGGDYAYLRRTFGETIGYLFAWGRLIIVQPGSIAAMSFLFAKYLNDFLLSMGLASPISPVYLAILAVVFLTILNSFQVQQAKALQNVLSVIKALCLILIFSAAFFIPGHSIVPQDIETTFNWSSFNLAIILILFTYGGWNEIAFVSTEVKNPNKNIFRSLYIAVVLVCVLYLLVNLSFFYALGYKGVVESSNVTIDTISQIFPFHAASITNLIIAISCLGATHGHIFTGSRINFVLGESYPALRSLARTRNNKPINAYLLQAFLSCLIIVIAQSFSQTIVYTTTVVWLFFFLTSISLMILRFREPSILRPYKIVLYPLTPIIFCLASGYLMLSASFYDPRGSGVSVLVLLAGLVFMRKEKK